MKRILHRTVLSCCFATLLSVSIGAGSQSPAGATAPAQEAPAPGGVTRLLKVQIVISRYEALTEAARKSGASPKKLSSDPYEVLVTPGQPAVNLRMGTQIPIPKDGSYQYMSIGTNIDCEARAIGGETFRIDLTIEDTSIKDKESRMGSSSSPSAVVLSGGQAVPTLQTFRTHNVLVMRSGESNQLTATDKVTGETIKVDLTVKAEK